MNILVPLKPNPNAVSATHRIVAYDRVTDELAFEQDIPKFLDTLAFKLAEIDEDDPNAAFSYELSPRQVTTFAFLIGITNNVERFEYFLEPGGHKVRDLLPQRAEAIAAFETLCARSASRNRRTQRITESELTVPALRVLEENYPHWVRTSDLIKFLTELFKPTGTDAAIFAGRTDTYFSQKVRNMISHRDQRSSFISNGLAEYSEYEQGLQITTLGRNLISGLRD